MMDLHRYNATSVSVSVRLCVCMRLWFVRRLRVKSAAVLVED